LQNTEHRKILFLVNPVSGTGNKEKIKNQIVISTRTQNIPFEICDTDPEGNYNYLATKIEAEKITDVVICGGDGSINQVLSYLQNTEVNIGIIPIGSGNGLAMGAGISRKLKKALGVVFQNKTKKIDAYMVNDKFGCMLTGLGFDANVASAFSKQKRRGLLGYIYVCLKVFFKKDAYRIRINIDGRAWEEKIFFISIANSNQFGNHITIAPKAILNDGLLDVVLVTKMNPFLSAIYLLKQILFGRVQRVNSEDLKKKKIYYWQTSEIEIENKDLAPLHIDGEPKTTSGRIRIKLIPQAIRLLIP
jgi:YegS/Rv2252/BmrU family lipid kinase